MDWVQKICYSFDSILRALMGMGPRVDLGRRDPRISSKPPGGPELVKQRPVHLEQRYTVQDNERRVDEVFSSMRASLITMTDEISDAARRGLRGKIVFRETGKTSEGRGFAFFKPMSDYGWLVERTGAGWRISRAEKIIDREMFLRSNSEPWDVAILYEDPAGQGQPRVKSSRFGNTLMALPVYQEKLRGSFEQQLLGN